MHGTLLYPLPRRSRSTRPKGSFRGFPRVPELPPDLRKRIAMWKGILLAKLLHRSDIRIRRGH
jgi:hypothetical protein